MGVNDMSFVLDVANSFLQLEIAGVALGQFADAGIAVGGIILGGAFLWGYIQSKMD